MNTEAIAIRSVTADYSLLWIKTSWALAKDNYKMALGLGFSIIIVSLTLQKIPLLGSVLSGIMNACLPYGLLRITSLWTSNKPAKYSDLFILFNDQALFQRALPLVIFQTAIAIPSGYLMQLPKEINYFGMTHDQLFFINVAVSLVIGLFTAFSAPQIQFLNRSLSQTITYNLQAIGKNFIPLVLSAVLITVITLLSVLLLVVPFLFVTLPGLLCIYYLVYASIFEGLELPIKSADLLKPLS